MVTLHDVVVIGRRLLAPDKRWLFFRLALVGLGIAGGPGLRDMEKSAAAVTVIVILLIASMAITVVMNALLIAFIAVVRRERVWHLPSWRRRPIFGEPLQFMHATSWYAIAAGGSGILLGIVSGSSEGMAQCAIVLGAGIGLWIGVQTVVHLLPNRFIP
jgi:hypothetical protein